MQKIMFSDKYGLTQAVLEGRKTQTRRIPDIQPPYKNSEICFPTDFIGDDEPEKHPLWLAYCWRNKDNPKEHTPWVKPRYKVGEVVAIAQSYKDLGFSETALDRDPKDWRVVRGTLGQSKGWNNKMFVRADMCAEKGHQIRITKVRIEKLQDISDEDCLAEGVVINEPKRKGGVKSYYPSQHHKLCAEEVGWGITYISPKIAYADLIDKVDKKGTWDSNPYVWVYEFELIK